MLTLNYIKTMVYIYRTRNNNLPSTHMTSSYTYSLTWMGVERVLEMPPLACESLHGASLLPEAWLQLCPHNAFAFLTGKTNISDYSWHLKTFDPMYMHNC